MTNIYLWHENLGYRSQSSKLQLVSDACQFYFAVLTNTDRGGFTWNGLLLCGRPFFCFMGWLASVNTVLL